MTRSLIEQGLIIKGSSIVLPFDTLVEQYRHNSYWPFRLKTTTEAIVIGVGSGYLTVKLSTGVEVGVDYSICPYSKIDRDKRQPTVLILS